MPTLGQPCTAPGALECHYRSDVCCCGYCEDVFYCASDSTTGSGLWQLRHFCPAGCREGELSKSQFPAGLLLQFNPKDLSHRCCHLAKPSWQLSWQLWKHSDNTSGRGTCNTFTIHCIQNWRLQRQTENHGWGRDHLVGEGLWLFPASQHQKYKQCHRDVLQNWCQ